MGKWESGSKVRLSGSSAYYKEIEPPVLLPTNEAIYLQGETVKELELVSLDLEQAALALERGDLALTPTLLVPDCQGFCVHVHRHTTLLTIEKFGTELNSGRLHNKQFFRRHTQRLEDAVAGQTMTMYTVATDGEWVALVARGCNVNEWVTNHLFLMSPNLNVVDTVEVKELSKNISLVHMVRTRLAQYVLAVSMNMPMRLFCIYRRRLHLIEIVELMECHRTAITLNVRVVPRAKKQHKGPREVLLSGAEKHPDGHHDFLKCVRVLRLH